MTDEKTSKRQAVRISNSWSPGEIKVLDRLCKLAMVGGDARVLARAGEFQRVARKLTAMVSRADGTLVQRQAGMRISVVAMKENEAMLIEQLRAGRTQMRSLQMTIPAWAVKKLLQRLRRRGVITFGLDGWRMVERSEVRAVAV